MDLTTCTLGIAAAVLRILLKEKHLKLAELEDRIVAQEGGPARINVLPAILLLFLQGAVDYAAELDALVLVPGAGGK